MLELGVTHIINCAEQDVIVKQILHIPLFLSSAPLPPVLVLFFFLFYPPSPISHYSPIFCSSYYLPPICLHYQVRMDPTKFAKQGICYKGFVCKVKLLLSVSLINIFLCPRTFPKPLSRTFLRRLPTS